jgi:hypothetical protein
VKQADVVPNHFTYPGGMGKCIFSNLSEIPRDNYEFCGFFHFIKGFSLLLKVIQILTKIKP